MIIKSLYEGILADMESTMSHGDSAAALISLNQPDSDARKMFGIDADNETPFSVKNNTLFVTRSTRKSSINQIVTNLIDYDITPMIKDLNVDTMLFRGGLWLFGKDHLTDNTLTPTIISSSMTVNNFKSISNINLICDPVRTDNSFVPSMKFGDTVKSITNCKLDIFYQNNSLRFCKIPTLKNVSSSTIETIRITDEQQKVEWRDTIFNKIFDFGYTVEFTHPGKDNINIVKINNMTDIRKLIVAKDFYSREYNEWPYKLKRGAKLSDLIDISGFEKLQKVSIYDKKMCIMFENTKLSNCHITAIGYFESMLKKITFSNNDKRISILEHIPMTVDGWNVFIIRT